MYADDQDEDVEEEEEFHDVEEEKHKTSQESVGSSGDRIQSPIRNRPSQRTKSEDSTGEIKASNTDVSETKSMSGEKVVTTIPNSTPDEKKSASASTVITTIDSVPEIDSSSVQNAVSTAESTVRADLSETPTAINAAVTNAANDSTKDDVVAPEGAISSQISEKSTFDWANMMLADHSDDGDSTSEATVSSDIAQSEQAKQNVELPSEDSIINNIVKDTQEKLKIVDESSDSIDRKAELDSEKKEDQQSTQETPEETTTKGEDFVEKSEPDVNESSEQIPDVTDAPAEPDTEESNVNEVEKKELDLDEDVKNPQYIPKKGVFYEHDDRSHDVEEKKPTSAKKEEDTTETKEASANKKNTSQDRQPENRRNNRRQRTDADRWNHDLFRGEKQKPKSKSELINAYGYDIRQERGGRQADGRQPRTNNSAIVERPQGSQDSQRSRQPKDGRNQRQNQVGGNRSRDRKTRRQTTTKNGQQRTEGFVGLDNKRDNTNSRSTRPDVKDLRESGDSVKHTTPPSSIVATNSRRDQENSGNRNTRTDSKGRRKTSRDRPITTDERPPTNAVMPPITTWSNEDMMKAEAFGKKSPPRIQPNNSTTVASNINNIAQRDRSTDFWHQNSQQNKIAYQDRSLRNQEDSRQQGYNARSRYQDRGNEGNRQTNYMPRNHFNDRPNQQQDWNRASNFSPYGKSTDYVVKTQTFENSRLSQANMNRSANNRDLREVINERRLQGQQSYQPKVHLASEHHPNHRGLVQGHMFQQQHYPQSHNVVHQHPQQIAHNQQQNAQQHLIHHHHQQQQQQQQQQQHQHHQQQPQQQQSHQQPQHSQTHIERQQQQQQTTPQQQTSNQTQQQRSSTNSSQVQQTVQNERQQATTIQAQVQQRQNVGINNVANDVSSQDTARLGPSSSTDPLSSRPIIKTDAYTGTGMHPHQPPLPHSQNHRSMTGPMTQQGPATSHMVPSHLGASSSQYYAPSPNSREAAANAAAVASAYHGYIPGGHTVMDATRYHMASQQLADHGYMTNPAQGSDVPGGPVIHQQGMYADAAGVAGSAYLPQPPGSTISPNANIPVTGSGGQPLPPVSYLQHSQYPPPPYSNPYSQHNQGPPQSGHYPPYWTYI